MSPFRLKYLILIACALCAIANPSMTSAASGDIYDLGALGGSVSFGRAVNDAGQVAGYAYTSGNAVRRAFRYDGTPGAGGVMRDLGTLGGTNGGGHAINDAGQVVGWSSLPGDRVQHAFLYTGTPGAGGQMIDLATWLDANNPAEGETWTLMWGHSLSNTGLISGTGYYDPDGPGPLGLRDRAFLLDASGASVPEPAGLSLLGLVMLAL